MAYKKRIGGAILMKKRKQSRLVPIVRGFRKISKVARFYWRGGKYGARMEKRYGIKRKK